LKEKQEEEVTHLTFKIKARRVPDKCAKVKEGEKSHYEKMLERKEIERKKKREEAIAKNKAFSKAPEFYKRDLEEARLKSEDALLQQ